MYRVILGIRDTWHKPHSDTLCCYTVLANQTPLLHMQAFGTSLRSGCSKGEMFYFLCFFLFLYWRQVLKCDSGQVSVLLRVF